MSEYKFNYLFREMMNQRGFHFDRIESHATSPGIPDCHYQHDGGSFGWLEMKQELFIPMRIKFQPRQAEWLYSYALRGGTCFVVLHLEQERQMLFVPGRRCLLAKQNLSSAVPFRLLAGRDETGEWDRAAQILKNRLKI